MLTDNNQIFRNWFIIIHRHLTRVSAQIIQSLFFERNELSITLSTLWCNYKCTLCMCNQTERTSRWGRVGESESEWAWPRWACHMSVIKCLTSL